MPRIRNLNGIVLVLSAMACTETPTAARTTIADVSLAKGGGGATFNWSFTGDVASDPAHPVATTLSDVYIVFPATTAGDEAVCNSKSTTGPTSNNWAGYSGAAWRGQATLQKKGQKWHFGFQGNQLDGDGGYLNLAVNGAATESTSGGTVTFSSEVGLVSAISHFGGPADAADRCVTFSVIKAPI